MSTLSSLHLIKPGFSLSILHHLRSKVRFMILRSGVSRTKVSPYKGPVTHLILLSEHTQPWKRTWKIRYYLTLFDSLTSLPIPFKNKTELRDEFSTAIHRNKSTEIARTLLDKSRKTRLPLIVYLITQ